MSSLRVGSAWCLAVGATAAAPWESAQDICMQAMALPDCSRCMHNDQCAGDSGCCPNVRVCGPVSGGRVNVNHCCDESGRYGTIPCMMPPEDFSTMFGYVCNVLLANRKNGMCKDLSQGRFLITQEDWDWYNAQSAAQLAIWKDDDMQSQPLSYYEPSSSQCECIEEFRNMVGETNTWVATWDAANERYESACGNTIPSPPPSSSSSGSSSSSSGGSGALVVTCGEFTAEGHGCTADGEAFVQIGFSDDEAECKQSCESHFTMYQEEQCCWAGGGACFKKVGAVVSNDAGDTGKALVCGADNGDSSASPSPSSPSPSPSASTESAASSATTFTSVLALAAGENASSFDQTVYLAAVASASGAPEADVEVVAVTFDVAVAYSVPDGVTEASMRAAIASAASVAEAAVALQTGRRLFQTTRRLATDMTATITFEEAPLATQASAALAQPEAVATELGLASDAGLIMTQFPTTSVNVQTSIAAAADGSVRPMPAPATLSTSLDMTVSVAADADPSPSPSPTPPSPPSPVTGVVGSSGYTSWRPLATLPLVGLVFISAF